MLELKTKQLNSIHKHSKQTKKPAMPELLRKEKNTEIQIEHNDKICLKSKDLYNFTRQLSNLLKAGMEIPIALEILATQTNRIQVKRIIEDFRKEVNSGRSLADAMNLYPGTFSEMYINVVYSAQSGGELDKSLEYLAEMLEKRNKISDQVNRALAYPTLMISVSIMVVMFLMTTVIPNIAALFLESGRELPFITKSLIFFSNSLQLMTPYIIVLSIAVFFAFKVYIKNPKNRIQADKKILNIPYLGRYLLEIETVRMCRSLCAMLRGGLTIVDSMDLASGAVKNSYMKLSINSISKGLTKGYSIEESFRRYGIFQPMVHHAIAIGESTGQLEKQLTSISDILDDEIDNKTNLITTMMEPIIMLIMGLLTGYIVAAMLLPIFEINSTF